MQVRELTQEHEGLTHEFTALQVCVYQTQKRYLANILSLSLLNSPRCRCDCLVCVCVCVSACACTSVCACASVYACASLCMFVYACVYTTDHTQHKFTAHARAGWV